MYSFSCKKSENESQTNDTEKTEVISTNPQSEGAIKSTPSNWDEIPDLRDIGTFPFMKSSAELPMNYEKDGVSEVFEYKTLGNFTGDSIYTTEGKLAILHFSEMGGKDFSQKWFDKLVHGYFTSIGAKKLYSGSFPENESQRKQMEKNMWNGKHATFGLLSESDSPITVYAFKSNSKKYI
ncbi:MAG: hypothetical protein ACRCVT_02890, partial [Leadbetterella sp.]